MRFAMLGSGSRGNCTLVQGAGTTVMVDNGFMLREAERRLARLGVAPAEIDGILVTHEHFDHIGGVARFARKHAVPVWMTPGTFAGWGDPGGRRIHNITPRDAFTVGGLTVQPFPVPHDAREPCHFVLSDGRFRVGVLSDAGSVTPEMLAALDGCDALLLEFNHDPRMLEEGPYDRPLKQRVGGPLGHLNNGQAADLLRAIDRSRLQHLVLTHLSEKNNTPAHARAACIGALGAEPPWLAVAHQAEGLPWRALS